MKSIETDIGKIYCRYNEDTDDFTMMRLCKIERSEADSKLDAYVFGYLDKNYMIDKDLFVCYNASEFMKIKKEWTVLKSEGIISLTNIVALQNETRQIKDVLAIYFPNNEMTKVPDVTQPYIVGRQGINNIFADMAGVDEVGIAVSIDTVPAGYALSDFMENTSVISSYLCHVYKTDTEYNLAMLLDNEESNDILQDLFDHEVMYLSNTDPDFKHDIDREDECLHGYCNSIRAFLKNSEFMLELYHKLGITPIDFNLTEGEEISLDDRLYLSSLYGGIRINKAVPLKFDYTINLKMIRMKYMMLRSQNDILYIVPYTESPDEITADQLYNLTEERTLKLQERLAKCVKAYDQYNCIKSGFASDMLD